MGRSKDVTSQVNRTVAELSVGRERWCRTGIAERIRLLDRMAVDTLAAGEEMVRVSCAGKGIDPESNTAGEEWLGGPATVLRHIRLLRETLAGIERTGRSPINPKDVEQRDGLTSIHVFPSGVRDRLMLSGFEASVHMEEGIDPVEAVETSARAYRSPPEHGDDGSGLCAVLGAGNVSSIGLLDILTKVFQENRVCALKLHPVNEYLEESYCRSFAALIEIGALRLIRGGSEEGAALVHHPDVTDVHITGSGAVHDAIVWGDADVRDRNRQAGTPVLRKPITSELGCVTPVLIVPGPWSPREMAFQAMNIASMVTNNASFNCNAAKVLITAAGWPQRDAFLDALRDALARVPTRRGYYPGAEERHARFLDAHPESSQLGRPARGHLAWGLATGLDPARTDAPAFTTEAWCGVLAETALPVEGAVDFLEAGPRFANDVLFGTLSCSILAHPASVSERNAAQALEHGIRDLRYGTVVLNHWAGLGYGLGVTPWGAHPGHTLADIGSGMGMVHNTLMLERPAKGVIRGPFAPRIKPLWSVDHRRAHRAGQALARFEARPGLRTLVALGAEALRG